MVGEGVLLECLNHPAVEQVLVINRKPGGISHPKLREIIHADFLDLAPIEPQLVLPAVMQPPWTSAIPCRDLANPLFDARDFESEGCTAARPARFKSESFAF